DVERRPEAFTRRLDERPLEVFAERVRRAVHEKVEPAEPGVDLRKERVDLRVVGDVARQEERIGQRGAEFLDVLAEALVLIRQRERGTFARRRLSNRPRDRALVG